MIKIDATSLPRFMQCSASVSMPVYSGMENTVSDDVREGLAAHWLANEHMSGRVLDIYEYADRKSPEGVYFTSEILESVSVYVETLKGFADDTAFTELSIGYRSDLIQVGCRADYVGFDDRKFVLRIADFKFGWRLVEPVDNWTLIIHALAFLQSRNIAHLEQYAIEFYIIQPRPFHPLGTVRKHVISVGDLMHLQGRILAQASSALHGNAQTVTGPSCYKCPSRSFCPALRNVVMNMVDVSETPIPDKMSPDEMSLTLDALTVGIDRLKQYKEALEERISEILRSGGTVRNYRFRSVESRLEWMNTVTPDVLRLLAPGKPVTKETCITPKQAMKFMPESVVATLSERKKSIQLVRSDTDQHAETLFGKGIPK